MSVLEVNNVSIRYFVGDFKDIGIKEYILRKIKGNYSVTEFWADKNITFSLEEGDLLGIIGANGAGKSTLLKAISGIMEPTEGSITAKGHIAALLELGSGFDGELTVRENTYLRGAMLGYTRKFMDDAYDDIIAFAHGAHDQVSRVGAFHAFAVKQLCRLAALFQNAHEQVFCAYISVSQFSRGFLRQPQSLLGSGGKFLFAHPSKLLSGRPLYRRYHPVFPDSLRFIMANGRNLKECFRKDFHCRRVS